MYGRMHVIKGHRPRYGRRIVFLYIRPTAWVEVSRAYRRMRRLGVPADAAHHLVLTLLLRGHYDTYTRSDVAGWSPCAA